MEKEMKFLNTWTLEEFAASHPVSGSLDVIPNEKTGKIFFAWGGLRGMVSKAAHTEEGQRAIQSNPRISEVETEEGSAFLLHKAAENRNVLFSFTL